MSHPDQDKKQTIPMGKEIHTIVNGYEYTPSMLPPGMNTPYNISEAELSHFRSNPWAQSLLVSLLRDGEGDYDPIVAWSRIPKPSTGEDGYVSQTLATSSTIPFLLTLRRKNIDSITASLPKQAPVANSNQKKSVAPSRPPDTITLVSLAAPGVCGHPSTAHGGLLATLFDEVMSLGVALHMLPFPDRPATSRGRGGHLYYTAKLDVRYKRPVAVPGLLVMRSWCVARDGRKYWTVAQALQEEQSDQGGHLEWAKRKTVRAEASALWIVPAPTPSKL